MMNEKRKKLTKLAVAAMLAAAALAMSFLETTLTAGLPLPPGVKPGFSNIAVLFACASLGLPSALSVAAVKAGFTLLTAGPTASLLSLCGGLLSVLAMYFLLQIKHRRLSYAGVSALSAVAHNLGQLAAASALVGSALYLSWLPVLLLSGVGFGLLTGVILNAVMPALAKLKLFR